MGYAKFFVGFPLALGAALAAVLLAASAGATPRPRGVGVRLEYKLGPRTQQCPDVNELRAEVAAGLGHDPFTEAGPWRLSLVVNKRRDGVYIATTTLFDDKGEAASDLTPLTARDCRYLVETMQAARTAALLVDLPAPPAPPTPTPPPPPPVVAPRPSDAPSPRAFRSVVRFGLGTVVGFGAAPRAAVGLTTDVGGYSPVAGLPFDLVSFAVGARWDPPAAGYVLGGVRVSASRVLATASPCAHVWKFYGCGVLGAGRFWGVAEDIALPMQGGSGNYVVTGGRLGVDLPFAPHLGFRGYGGVLANVTPQAIPIDERPGWITPPASGGLGVGLYLFD